MRRLGPDAALLLASPPEQLRNGDTHFKFRQDSDILYLTGFEEPGTVVVVRPGHETMRFVLFVPITIAGLAVFVGRHSRRST